MKTIREIASEIGVSKTAVFKKIKTINGLVENYTSTVGNTLYVNEDGEALIKQAFGNRNEPDNVNLPVIESKVDDNILLVTSMIQSLTDELDIKNKQIDALNQTILELTSKIPNSEPRKGFWDRLMGR